MESPEPPPLLVVAHEPWESVALWGAAVAKEPSAGLLAGADELSSGVCGDFGGLHRAAHLPCCLEELLLQALHFPWYLVLP